MARGTSKRLLNDFQIEKVVGSTPHNNGKVRREHIEKGRGVAIEAIQSYEDGGGGKPKLRRVGGDYPNRPLQFTSIVPIPRSTERAEKLMGMRLENHRPRTYNLSPLAALIARRTNLIETTMRCGQRLHLRQRPLASNTSRAIHIHHRPLPSRPVEQTTGGKQMGCELADPLEKARAGPPLWAGREQPESGKGLSDGVTGCAQRGT